MLEMDEIEGEDGSSRKRNCFKNETVLWQNEISLMRKGENSDASHYFSVYD